MLLGFSYNGAKYYYIRNLQSDIIGILDNSGNQVVSYTYDSWGKLLSIEGNAKDTIGVQNPFRYRGYYYDTETGFYYLNSRYYDPMVGRFLNADSVVPDVGGNIKGYNVFAYCYNNPVNSSDYTGNWPQWLDDFFTWVDNNIFKPIANFFNPNTNTASGDFQDGIIRGSGSATAGYSESNVRLQVNSNGNDSNGMLGAYGKVSVGNANGEIGIGNNDYSISIKGVGDGLTATAQAGLQYQTGIGFAARAKASVLTGRVSIELVMFDWEIEFGVSGDVLSVGAETMIGIFPDEGFVAQANAGAGLVGGGFVFRARPI